MLGAPGGDRDDDGGAQDARGGPADAPSSPRGLVLACADLLHRGDVDGARRVADMLLSGADPRGDAADRLAQHFARVLARRIDDKAGDAPTAGGAAPAPAPSAYLAYNKIAPFLRFAHLTANQAILDAAAIGGARRVHIVDLDAAYGVQWPPLLQAIADGADPAVGPPEVRITGAGPDHDALLRTGDRLRAFSSSINLPFRFRPLLLPCTAQLAADRSIGLELHPDETLAVNCVLFLHKLGGEGEVAKFLRWVKSMNPTVVTIAEREASIGSDCPDELPRRVAAAMDYYSAVFDALEATVPPGSADRLAVENEILAQEIETAVAPGRTGGRARVFEAWATVARAAGLSPRPLSTFAVSQARLLLRLHYPSEGYVVEEARGACFLGWQTRPLMSVSSWQ
ncbi:protein MONOCULM 1-like [Phragmites australis]|uniref:protein MONOCULM 1-like n=1 Tax=Phragmites australis TaxID=29695 RepID=UPI002D775015|nr:protein MONOCULM 1-like [Phragmites australis]